MAIANTSQPSLRVRVLPRFPAQVVAGNGITILKNGSTYTFSVALEGIPFSGLEDMPAQRLLGRDDTLGTPLPLEVVNGLEFTGANSIQATENSRIRDVSVMIYQNGSTLTTGIKADIQVPFACTIVACTLLADQSGSVVVDIWKDTFANFPPVVGDSIVAAAKPTLSGAASVQAALTGWTIAIAAEDILRFNFDSVATITRLQISLKVLVT